MDDAPPYSPTTTTSERRLPDDYTGVPVEDEEDGMMRPKNTTPRSRPDSRDEGSSLSRRIFL
ncbi:hypothetical protein K504DRAFT_462278 [Pleomassaria siparia CBS 279.74]|uniref:Uncharacterized protein n=1 Tax=Pleomassaria siparia CBS 279.74 TaxID=1314801 RepID=A0A6G1KMT5_9PLEO|nr:hypothetical protein K504DRAFT_462278 [Pleomassaria siparia CBS 279.74]